MQASLFGRSLALALIALASFSVSAQSYPDKRISVVVPFPAGGPADASARVVAPQLQKELGQTVIIENFAGAGGSIGVNKVLSTPADGYTLLLATVAEPILPPLTLPWIKYKPEDLRLVSQLSHTNLVLVARQGLHFKDVNDLLSYARNPANKALSYATPGSGTLYHLMSEHFKLKTDAKMVHIPYKGLAPMMNDLLGGQVDVAFLPVAGNVVTLIEQGKLRAVGTASTSKIDLLKHVSPLGDGTPSLKGFSYTVWTGLFVARSTPEAVVGKIHAGIDEVLKHAEFRSFIREAGGVPRQGAQSLAEASSFYAAEAERIKAVHKTVKLETD